MYSTVKFRRNVDMCQYHGVLEGKIWNSKIHI